MKRTLLTYLAAAAILFSPSIVEAQSVFPTQIAEICSNNPALKALRGQTDATKQDNLTGLNLPNPEVGVTYMWGQPSDVPNKTNIEVVQPFDFATLSGAKKRVALADNRITETDFAIGRQQVILEAEKALINYSYTAQLVGELETQTRELAKLDSAASKALDKGQINILERNKIQLEYVSRQNELALARADLQTNMLLLTQLNGGQPLSQLPAKWTYSPLPSSFDEWIDGAVASNPEILRMQAAESKAQQEISLRKSEGLPEFSVGYANELVRGGNYHGFTVGVSVPLWGNRGRVKAAQAARAAAAIDLDVAQQQFCLRKQTEYDRAIALKAIADQYAELNDAQAKKAGEYLDKALAQGAISIFEYMTEKEDLYAHTMRCLEAQRDYCVARADLYAETF